MQNNQRRSAWSAPRTLAATPLANLIQMGVGGGLMASCQNAWAAGDSKNVLEWTCPCLLEEDCCQPLPICLSDISSCLVAHLGCCWLGCAFPVAARDSVSHGRMHATPHIPAAHRSCGPHGKQPIQQQLIKYFLCIARPASSPGTACRQGTAANRRARNAGSTRSRSLSALQAVYELRRGSC